MVWGIFITLSGPFMFEGIRIVEKQLDSSYFTGFSPLHFSLNNVTQVGYLIVNLTTLYCVYAVRDRVGADFAKRSFLVSAALCVFLGYWEFISKTTGLIPFPSHILLNSGEMYEVIATDGRFRMSSVTPEASYYGLFISPFFWSLLSMRRSLKLNILLVLAAITIPLNLSGTGFIALAAGAMVYILMNRGKAKYVVAVALMVGLSAFLVLHTDIGQSFYTMVEGKKDTQSGVVRLGVTLRNLEILYETYGLGVGLGSTRGSSFIVDLLACTGVIGTFLYMRILYFIGWRRKNDEQTRYIFVYFVTLFLGQCASAPDFSNSFFWMGLFVSAASIINTYDPNKKKPLSAIMPTHDAAIEE